MRKIAVVGGKLQGLEAVYLAMKAGMETTLIDQKEGTPASGLCDRLILENVLEKKASLITALKQADFVLPALEDVAVLKVLDELSQEHDFRLAFDIESYGITSSKIASDQLMTGHGFPVPLYYPDCTAPYIIKPSASSGSQGVTYIETQVEMEVFLKNIPSDEKWVAQEFLSGPSYSMEVLGTPGSYRTYEVTEIHMDEVYDCKRVTLPWEMNGTMRRDFSEMCFRLASVLQLKGIMDVEVINHGGVLKILEIDARLPSQTPTAVYHGTGINLVEELADLFCEGGLRLRQTQVPKAVSFEHLLINGDQIRAAGEHIISQAGPLALIRGFCGADEVLTDHQEGAAAWRGTFINHADTQAQLEAKRESMLNNIRTLQGKNLPYVSLSPACGKTWSKRGESHEQ